MKQAVTLDIGSPVKFNNVMHGPAGLTAINNSIEALEQIEFEKLQGKSTSFFVPNDFATLQGNYPFLQSVDDVLIMGG